MALSQTVIQLIFGKERLAMQNRSSFERGEKDGANGKPRNIFGDKDYEKGYDYGQGLRHGSQRQKDINEGTVGEIAIDVIAQRETLEKLGKSEEYKRGYDRGKATYGKDPAKVPPTRSRREKRRTSAGGGGGGGGGAEGGIWGWVGTAVVAVVLLALVVNIGHWWRYNTKRGLKFERTATSYHKVIYSPVEKEDYIYRVDINSGVERKLGQGRNLSFSPDGQKLAFVRKDSFGERIWVGDIYGNNLRFIKKTSDFCWGPNNHYLIYVKKGLRQDWLNTAQIKDRANYFIGPFGVTGRKERISNYSCSPLYDVAYVAKEGEKEALYIDRYDFWKRPPVLTGKKISILGWSKNGDKLAFCADGGIFFLDLTDQAGRRVKSIGAQTYLGGFNWSPLNNNMAVLSYEGQIGAADLIRDRRETSTEGRPPITYWQWLTEGYMPVWSPDGEKIAFLNGGDLYFIYANGTGRRMIAQRVKQFIWAPNSSEIYFTRGARS